MKMDYYTDTDFEELSSPPIDQVSESDESYAGRNSVPRPSRFQRASIGSNNSYTRNNSVCYKPSPFGWQPPSITRQQSNVSDLQSIPSEFETDFSDGFVYIDPDSAYNKAEAVPVHIDNKGVEARKVCKQISQLLKDKDSPSRGSRMFQKRRKRAPKFTIIGYGTQPVEDDCYKELRDEEASSSEELSRLDYTTDEDEIAAYDKPGVHNILTASANLNPSQQLVQKQLKNLAMDVGGMRGKGAKIFAKRQQRMENYVITDENRKPIRNRSMSTDRELPPRAPRDSSQGPYVRPGSSIAITPKPMYAKQPMNFNRAISGYSTDVEDDYKTNRKPQVNYFSDCEGMGPERPGRSRRTRPMNRRSWEDDNTTDDVMYINSDNVGQTMTRNRQKPPFADYSSAGEESQPKSPFRRVLPPGRTPYMSPGRGSRDSSLTRNTSLSPARTEVSDQDPQAPRRTWTRVTFNPRKVINKQSQPGPAVDYPCDRTYTSQSKPPIAKALVSRAPSHSPQRQTTAYSKPLMPTISQPPPTPRALLPKVTVPPMKQSMPREKSPATSDNLATVPINDSNSVNEYKPSSAVSLLEKPMKPVVKTTSHITLNKFVADAPPSANDFVGNSNINLSDIVSSIEKQEQSEQFDTKFDNGTVVDENNVQKTENMKEEDENVRASSPASVLSYVSSNSNSSTFTSMLPSRCLTPPARSFTPNGSRAIKIVSSKKSTQENPTSPVNNVKPTTPLANVKEPTPSAPVPPAIPPVASAMPKRDTASENPPQGDKISACLKVLDPSKMLFKPKPPVQYQPSPTLNAILQSENEDSYGSMKTPPMSYEYPCEKVIDIKSPPAPPKPVTTKQPAYSYQPPQSPSMKKRYSPPGQAPQPLGIIAEGMKGKGAKMFEKQLKRMQQYTKETSHEDFPELQSQRQNGSISSPTMSGRFSYQQPRMAGFSQTGEKLEPEKHVKTGMREVMGEFQRSSTPGNVKRPSETKKKGRDPLYYQQQLFYRPPSADDFVQPPPESFESQSDASSVTSSRTNASSVSSFGVDPKSSDVYPVPQKPDNNSTSPTASRSSLGGDMRSTNSSSSISSQKSVGPKTAPKPSKAVITRQLSKPTTPPPTNIVSTSPTPEIEMFKPSPSSTAISEENDEFIFQGTEKEGEQKCIENLIERMPDDHRLDCGSNDIESRRRVTSVDQTNGHSTNDVTDRPCDHPVGFQPPSYNDVISGSKGEQGLKKVGEFSVRKPKFNIRKNVQIPVQMWKPGQ